MIHEADDLVSLFPANVEKRGIHVFTHREVTKIDRTQKTVTVRDLDSDAEETCAYDKLVIATGASPIRLRLPGADAEGVCCLRTVEDGIVLKAKAVDVKNVAIIGGFIGLALAEQFTLRGANVHVLKPCRTFCPSSRRNFPISCSKP